MSTAKCSLTPRDDTYPFIEPSRFKGKLSGKVVLITGAGRGLGRTAAHAFAAVGASVACVARRQNDIDAVVAEIKEKYRTPAVAINADVAAPSSGKHILSQVKSALGPVDVLINNAGVTRFNSFEAEDESLTDWWRVMEVNLRGCLAMIKAVLPSMLERGSGTIISLASTSGSQDIPFNTAYAVSKAGLIKFHQDLAVEIGGRGVYTYAVHPGTVATDLPKVEGAMNMETVMKTPKMLEMVQNFQGTKMQTSELSANTFVALCADESARVLSGKYVDSQFDLGEVIEDAKKGKESRIEKEKLYHLKLDEL